MTQKEAQQAIMKLHYGMKDVQALLTHRNNTGLTTLERYKSGEIDNPSGYLMEISREVIKVNSVRDISRRNEAISDALQYLRSSKH
jgi:hypothetical protein